MAGLNLLLFAGGDILADGLGRALHGFAGHLQIRQQFHLLTPVIEGSLLSHRRQHPAYAGESSVWATSSSTAGN
jgi:hypothetical protein